MRGYLSALASSSSPSSSLSPFNPLMLRGDTLLIVVWIYDNFDNTFYIKNDLTKYLKERKYTLG